MTRGVFLHRADSIYDDRPEVQYQFPKQYLARAEALVGDWIIYCEPRRGGGGRGYFAMARVQQIIPDPAAPSMYLALIEPGSYLDFERNVPFSGSDGRVEREVPNAQWAVRPVSLADFNRILDLGFPDEELLLPRLETPLEAPYKPGVGEQRAPFEHDEQRERVGYYSSRIVRDRVFRKIVLDAYDRRCAITGLRLINGGGRAEVQAAHIRPVEVNGPDIIINGIALSGTAHWMFDRGLISLSDDLEVLVSRQVNDVDTVWGLVNKSRKAAVPSHESQRPHPSYLAWHREHCFKQ